MGPWQAMLTTIPAGESVPVNNAWALDFPMDDTVGSGNINGKPKAAKGTSHMGGEEEEETKNHKAHKHDARKQSAC